MPSAPKKSLFRDRLDACKTKTPKSWVYVPYDQLSDQIGPLSRDLANELGIVLIESSFKGRTRPYHQQKLAFVLSAMRHFALEQAESGRRVHYIQGTRCYVELLGEAIEALGSMTCMEPAERELRMHLAPLTESSKLKFVPHEGWLSGPEDFDAVVEEDARPRMDAFYRAMRRKTGVLMEGDTPEGGKFSFDASNRKPWKGEPEAPERLTFEADAITLEVCDFVAKAFAEHPGTPAPELIPASAEDAETLWSWAKRECMPHFGPYEDAMTTESKTLFHTQVSALVNVHRLLPLHLIREVEAMPIAIESREGFIRQVLGWREYMRHVHRRTDGLRVVPDLKVQEKKGVGDADYRRVWNEDWQGASPGAEASSALPNALGTAAPLPAAFWGAESGLRCLDHVVGEVWADGYGHHITRLMVLCNLATLLDIDPRQVTDWFWVAYIDAYDWVVEPNVLGMGMFATGDYMTTKPYVSGSPYINKMSDYCGDCAFHPKKTCPISPMYWAFLGRHQSKLGHIPRLNMPLASLKKRSGDKKKEDARIFKTVSSLLQSGKPVTPDDL